MALLRSCLSLEVGLLLLTVAPDLGRGEAPLATPVLSQPGALDRPP